ncbi:MULTISPECIES: 3,4-dihydroxy-2-butanone-4-phosphate synthase [unclassified Haloferax]|uniref:3,4-dihydroxy-2-butanone-4-phosphate synthase n=1 Tax=unclassified Haloferax TaxID=2625095 RepID=UPI0028751278|nr:MULTISPECIES: 3,4-dihydroxy-2-butanone-4-phosphate synthase [unclassified Haloferax]MDS0241848.1 3,4-dihydroxy-2-butanone-4-phosphate synthase [Haloferax sp. S2CR25]MDS0444969.1 3,4-dihydroxy-2-butanone-4-phosphate synthase [Haloferax sp. S2CR25-2]
MSRTAESTGDFDSVSRVLDAFRAGEPVLVHDFDDREGETDLVYPAGAVGPADVARMRNDAGGLVCVALPNDVSEALGLPFIDEVLDHPAASSHDLAYDSRSSFSFTVNHRDSFTGITDRDRAMTISRLAPVAEAARTGEYDADDFGGEFRAPGHVHLLRGAPNLLSDRQGHTELGLALADGAGIPPAVVVCEMLDDETGAALPKDAARDYADRHGFAFVDGDGLIDELV